MKITTLSLLSLLLLCNCTGSASDKKGKYSKGADSLIKAAFAGTSAIYDYHTHIICTEDGGYVNPKMTSVWHLKSYITGKVYMSAGGIKHLNKAGEEYFETIENRASDFPPSSRFCIFAFDQAYNTNGIANPAESEFYTPNDYVVDSLCGKQKSKYFIPVISIHPYRKDAISELKKYAARGVKMIKWLPNAMVINPDTSLCDAFYDVMRENNMVLICHSGEEKAVHSEENQKLGNPLLLRRALDHGVKVIMAHCSSLGTNYDIDSTRIMPMNKIKRPEKTNFEYFLRMMDDPKYKGLLYGDISALTQYNRYNYIIPILEREDLHSRLVNGSDYPLPAIKIVISLKKLYKAGLITKDEIPYLDEIREHNPLLFDYVLKRTIRYKGKGFPASIFERNPTLGL